MVEKPIMVGALVIVVLAFTMSGLSYWNLSKERAAHTRDNKAFATRVEQSEKDKTAAQTLYENQRTTALKQKGVDDAQIQAMATELAKLSKNVWDEAARSRTLSSDLSRLRNVSSYARGPANDTAIACQRRAANLSDLLGEGDAIIATLSDRLEASERLAGEAAQSEAHRTVDVNTCANAWPGGKR